MKIYTKTGDKGTTGLASGERVAKTHPRVEGYGTIDELCSYLGLLISLQIADSQKLTLRNIQSLLMQCSAMVSGSKKTEYFITSQEIAWLETEIDKLQDALPSLQNFIIPGGGMEASHCHIARCVCRRAERRCWEVEDNSEEYNRVLQFLNRLSDYLFVLARTLCLEHNGEEEFWERKNTND